MSNIIHAPVHPHLLHLPCPLPLHPPSIRPLPQFTHFTTTPSWQYLNPCSLHLNWPLHPVILQKNPILHEHCQDDPFMNSTLDGINLEWTDMDIFYRFNSQLFTTLQHCNNVYIEWDIMQLLWQYWRQCFYVTAQIKNQVGNLTFVVVIWI